jgi:hypothetical protein
MWKKLLLFTAVFMAAIDFRYEGIAGNVFAQYNVILKFELDRVIK